VFDRFPPFNFSIALNLEIVFLLIAKLLIVLFFMTLSFWFVYIYKIQKIKIGIPFDIPISLLFFNKKLSWMAIVP
jgi:hypothetical protein